MKHTLNRKAGYLILSACMLVLVLVLAPAQAQQAHAHAEHGTMHLELDHGRLWATDAPLREGMERVHAAVVKQADVQGGLNAAQATTLAAGVEDGIVFMVQHCKLEPKADANLHILLERLSAAATAVKANPKAANGLPQMLEVLDTYPRYFNHPGWKAIAHRH